MQALANKIMALQQSAAVRESHLKQASEEALAVLRSLNEEQQRALMASEAESAGRKAALTLAEERAAATQLQLSGQVGGGGGWGWVGGGSRVGGG